MRSVCAAVYINVWGSVQVNVYARMRVRVSMCLCLCVCESESEFECVHTCEGCLLASACACEC